jgi:hypothetical protein
MHALDEAWNARDWETFDAAGLQPVDGARHLPTNASTCPAEAV